MKLENEDGLPWTTSTGIGWIVLIVALSSGTAFIALAFYLALWIRSKGRSALPLYGFAFSVICGLMVLTLDHFTPDTIAAKTISPIAFIVWIAATFALRKQIVQHFKVVEGWNLIIGPVFTFLFSVLYINYCLNPVTLSHENTITSLDLSSPHK